MNLKLMSLRAKILLASSITLIFMTFLGIESVSIIYNLTNTKAWVDHTHKVVGEALKIETAAVNIETGMRGFLLAGDEQFLEPLNSGKKSFNVLLSNLKETVKDDPNQLELLQNTKDTIDEWLSTVVEPSIELRRQIGTSKSMNVMAKLIQEEKGKKYFDKFRGQISLFKKREESLLIKREKALENETSLNQVRDAVASVNHTHKVISEAQTILAAAIDMETGMRGYLLAGKENFLEPFNSGRQRLFEVTRRLKTTVSDNPAQVSLLGEIEILIEEWIEKVVEPAIALRREIGHAKTMDDMATLVAQAKGKKYFDKFRKEISNFRNIELKIMAERQEAAKSSVTTAYAVISSSIIVAIILSLLVAKILGNSIINPFRNIFGGLKSFSSHELELLNQNFSAIVADMTNSAKSMNNVSAEISSASDNLSSSSNHQAASVEQTSTSMEELSGIVRNNVKLTEQSKNLSDQVRDQMGTLTEAMKEINESNKQIENLAKVINEIGEKTSVIDEIVFQTKLLSFNASVEAERAGEHGRGFAVVAQEVGSLAQMSGKAALEISQIVKESTYQANAIVKENAETRCVFCLHKQRR